MFALIMADVTFGAGMSALIMEEGVCFNMARVQGGCKRGGGQKGGNGNQRDRREKSRRYI